MMTVLRSKETNAREKDGGMDRAFTIGSTASTGEPSLHTKFAQMLLTNF